MNRRLKLYKQAATWIKRAAEEFDPSKTYSLDEYSKFGMDPPSDISPLDVQQFLTDEYNRGVNDGSLFEDRLPGFVPIWKKSLRPIIYDYTPEQKAAMYNKFRSVKKFIPTTLPHPEYDNPGLDFEIVLDPTQEEEAAYNLLDGRIYVNSKFYSRPAELQASRLAHEGTHGAVNNILDAAYRAYGYNRRDEDNYFRRLFDFKNNPLQGDLYNARLDEWPTTVVGSTFTLHDPSRKTNYKNNINLIETDQYAVERFMPRTIIGRKNKDFQPSARVPILVNNGRALTNKFSLLAHHFPATPMRYAVNQSGHFDYDTNLDQVVYNSGENSNIFEANLQHNGELSTMPPNAYRAYTNLMDIPTAWEEFKAMPHEFLEMREMVQKALRPLYAQSKPYVYIAGDYDGFNDDGEALRKVDRALTVAQLINGCLDPKNGKNFRNQHIDEIKVLQPEIRRRLDDIIYPESSDKQAAGQFDETIARFYNDFPEFKSPGLIGTYPDGLTNLQYEYSITPGFDMPSDLRTMEQMQDILDHIQYLYERKERTDKLREMIGYNRNWA